MPFISREVGELGRRLLATTLDETQTCSFANTQSPL